MLPWKEHVGSYLMSFEVPALLHSGPHSSPPLTTSSARVTRLPQALQVRPPPSRPGWTPAATARLPRDAHLPSVYPSYLTIPTAYSVTLSIICKNHTDCHTWISQDSRCIVATRARIARRTYTCTGPATHPHTMVQHTPAVSQRQRSSCCTTQETQQPLSLKHDT
jgi:hypothetical protein